MNALRADYGVAPGAVAASMFRHANQAARADGQRRSSSTEAVDNFVDNPCRAARGVSIGVARNGLLNF